ncbi:MAG: hypothetical protein J6V89_03045 [Acetobacter sp.]|nr:hypothetical protein [Acetobacter sp.]
MTEKKKFRVPSTAENKEARIKALQEIVKRAREEQAAILRASSKEAQRIKNWRDKISAREFYNALESNPHLATWLRSMIEKLPDSEKKAFKDFEVPKHENNSLGSSYFNG